MTIHLPKVNQFGGGNGGGGGSSSFPTTVTSSGSSLPATTGFQEGDTFLNTSDKKLYTAQVGGYVLNTGVTNSADLNTTTGVVSGFSTTKTIYKTPSNLIWSGSDVVWNIHFKIDFSVLDNTKKYMIGFIKNFYSTTHKYFVMLYIENKKIYFVRANTISGGSASISSDTLVLDYELQSNVDYFFRITKNGTSALAKLFINNFDDTEVSSNTISTADWTISGQAQNNLISYGKTQEINGNFEVSDNMQVYLLDSSGDFLVESSELSWNGGTSLTDKTEVADKTNGILYLYENTELIQIPQNKNLVFTNVSASSWVSDSTYTDYGYKCELSCSGVTANDFAQVIFAPTEADSGNYATVCQTGSGTVTIYSKVNDSITIPSIVVMGV